MAFNGLKVENLSMVYEVPNGEVVQALDNVSFDLDQGDLLSILGPSGCGKTTLLNIIAGFLKQTAGSVILGEKEVHSPGADRGMVFQQGALFEWLSVRDNVGFGLKMARKPKSLIDKKVAELLEVVGLAGFETKAVYELSGGMQQRVALARCLANDPDIILMDEPLGALDALTREKMQSLILKLWKETNKTIILITHSVEEALFLGNRLFVMEPRPGRIKKMYDLPFANKGLESNPREIKTEQQFIQTREEILNMIWKMEEQIMQQAN